MPEEIELSEREREILRLVATGASNKEIAYRLVISPNTVKVHLRNIFAKVGVASRTEATLYAIRSGLLPTPAATLATPAAAGVPEEKAQPEAALNADVAAVQEKTVETGQRRKLARVALALAVIALAALGTLLWNVRTAPQNTLTPIPVAALPARWSALAELPQAMQDLAGAVYADQIYITGGEDRTGVSGRTWRYDAKSNRWTACADKPTPVRQASAALLGEKIYVPGGLRQDGRPTRTLEVYDPRVDRWEQAAPLPEARSAYALVAFEGRIYLFGGWDGEKVSGSVFAYDPEQDKWETRAGMITARFFASVATVSGKILVMGGSNGKTLDTVEAYYPSRDQPGETAWEALPPMPYPRLAAGAAVIADMVYLIGGEDIDASEEESPPMQYVPATGQWNVLEASPTAAGARLLVLPLDTHLHILGGAAAGGASAQHQAYQAIYNLVFPVIQ